jgi:hypothetical protein
LHTPREAQMQAGSLCYTKPKLRNWGLLLVLVLVLGNPDVSQSE